MNADIIIRHHNRDCVMSVSWLKEGEDVIEMLWIAHAHSFAVSEAPEPESRRSQIVTQKFSGLSSYVVSMT
jgi:hypothetical protein